MNVPFTDLPPEVRERIANLSKNASSTGEHFCIPLEGIGGKIVGILFGFLLLLGGGALGIFAEDWDAPVPWFVLGGVFLGLLIVIFAWSRAAAVKRSAVRPAILATPILIARVGTDREPIQMHYHKDLTDFNATHHHTNGAYTGTSFNLTFRDGRMVFQINGKARAESLLAYLRGSVDHVRAWAEDGSLERRIAELDWIGAAASAQASGRKSDPLSRPFLATGWGKLLLSAAATGVLAPLLYGSNLLYRELDWWGRATDQDDSYGYRSYMDYGPLQFWKAEAEKRFDDRSYEEAARTRHPGNLRQYLKSFPAGAHREEARALLRELYAEVAQRYLETAKKAEPAAAEGMKALLAHLADQDEPKVTICFAPAEGIDGREIEQTLREATGSSKIHGVGPSFTAERNQTREGRIMGVMQASFGKVLSGDYFDLQPGTVETPGARFLVRYHVIGSGTYYVLDEEEGLPLEQKQIYVGIKMEFDFTTQVPGTEHPPDPDASKGWRFNTIALPAKNIDLGTGGSEATYVYDRMADTSFQDFEVKLANAFGLELVLPDDFGKLPGSSYRPSYRPPVIDIPKLPEIPKIDIPKLETSLPTAQAMADTEIAKAEDEDPPADVETILARVKARCTLMPMSAMTEIQLKLYIRRRLGRSP